MTMVLDRILTPSRFGGILLADNGPLTPFAVRSQTRRRPHPQ